jgi:hypothetical protein
LQRVIKIYLCAMAVPIRTGYTHDHLMPPCGVGESTPVDKLSAFVRNYISRHRDPGNAFFHVFGVPLAPFLCLYLLARGRFRGALMAFIAGYFLQWVGHTLQGNEVGEWVLVKNLAARVTGGATRGAE